MSKTTPEQWQQFYQKVAYAAFAVAAADNHIAEQEMKALREQVQQNWLDLEDTVDEFGTDAAYQTEIVFDWLAENDLNSEDALAEFKDYVESAQSFLTNDLRMQVVHLCNKIAVSFHGANKSELGILLRIQQVLF
jgi:uncharacterized tellurite resistance protein B-like protein